MINGFCVAAIKLLSKVVVGGCIFYIQTKVRSTGSCNVCYGILMDIILDISFEHIFAWYADTSWVI